MNGPMAQRWIGGHLSLALLHFSLGVAAADQPGSHWAPLTDADVTRVVKTFGELIEAAESNDTAAQPTDIETSGLAEEVLWTVETKVSAIDQSGRRASGTLRGILVANGYPADGVPVLEIWRHYAKRVLETHDAIRLGYFERDLGGEWQALHRASGGEPDPEQVGRLLEIDRAARIVSTSGRDRDVVAAHSERIEALRERVANWPER